MTDFSTKNYPDSIRVGIDTLPNPINMSTGSALLDSHSKKVILEPSMKFNLRPATQSEKRKIRSLTYQSGRHPFGLNWHNFVVAVASSGEIIGCGQIRRHIDGSRELASIAVDPEYQNEGIGSALIEHLLNMAPRPIFVTCRSDFEGYYSRFGFRSIGKDEMSPYHRRIHSLTNTFLFILRREEQMLIMRLG